MPGKTILNPTQPDRSLPSRCAEKPPQAGGFFVACSR